MKMYKEIIKTSKGLKLSNLIVESENSDPLLCSECQKHGYCTAKFYKHPATNELIPIPNSKSNKRGLKLDDQTPITDREISNLVNVSTDIKEASTKFGKKLQHAHDLFHQDEFEQASYMYLDIIETRADITEAWKGLLACFYFLGKYDEAISVSMYNILRIDSSFIDKLVNTCEYLINEENDLRENVMLNDSNTFSAAGFRYAQPIDGFQ